MRTVAKTLLFATGFHLVTSAVWAAAFALGMSTFTTSQNGSASRAGFFIHDMLLFPLYGLARTGVNMKWAGEFQTSDGTITFSPFPTFATIVWSIVMGFLLQMVFRKKKEQPNPEGSVERSRHRTLDEQARSE